MKFGVREICDVVFKAKATQKVGNKVFYKHEPVIYFDTLKTSSLEGSATTVYATGGSGNSRLVAWEGERVVTFMMEDALISPAGFMILSGAGLIEASKKETLKVHTTEQTDKVVVDEDGSVIITLSDKPYVGEEDSTEDYMYVMKMENGEVVSEPYIPDHKTIVGVDAEGAAVTEDADPETIRGWQISLIKSTEAAASTTRPVRENGFDDLSIFKTGDVVLVDYYVERASGAQQIEITPDKFGGNYYVEASTLFRNTDGVDMPAEFIIPNCKVQSNFNFTMASSGDPSTFSFTMDVFPDYTRFNKTKKVLAAIQIIDTGNAEAVLARTRTDHDPAHESYLR